MLTLHLIQLEKRLTKRLTIKLYFSKSSPLLSYIVKLHY